MSTSPFKNAACNRMVITADDYDYIYISPHLDDVSFSCSGAICAYKALGCQQLIITLFAGDPRPPLSPLAQAYHQLWNVQDNASPYQVRKEEDERAMSALGVDYVWLDWPEIIYRIPHGADLSVINDDHADAQRDPLFPLLCQWLVDLHATYPEATIVLPSGIGGHRDHSIIFQAALAALDRDASVFFEDFPYVAYLPERMAERVKCYHLEPFEIDISHCLECRIQCTGFYQSQHAMLFYPATAYQDLIRTYTSDGGHTRFVERYWRLP